MNTVTSRVGGQVFVDKLSKKKARNIPTILERAGGRRSKSGASGAMYSGITSEQ